MKQLIFIKKYIDPILGKFRPGDYLELEDKLAELFVNSGYAKYVKVGDKIEVKNTEAKIKTEEIKGLTILETFADYKEIDLSSSVSEQIKNFKKKFKKIKAGEVLFYIVVQVKNKIKFVCINDFDVTKLKSNDTKCYIVAEMFWYH